METEIIIKFFELLAEVDIPWSELYTTGKEMCGDVGKRFVADVVKGEIHKLIELINTTTKTIEAEQFTASATMNEPVVQEI